jgi:hypothetical protein
MKTKNHKARFERWKNRLNVKTKYLCELIENQLVPLIHSYGFKQVEVSLLKDDDLVAANEIRMERIVNDNIDSIYIFFDKYERAKFQIGFNRKSIKLLNEFVPTRHLVKDPSQYYFWWGKPWWYPLSFWGESNSKKTIDEIMPLLPQILEFLESGNRGKNISMEV